MTIEIPRAVMRLIEDHARDAYPEEGCGFLFGRMSEPRRAVESRRARNVATEDRSRRYTIDLLELLRADDDARKKRLDLIGIYHSHPDHPAAPSEFDRSRATSWYSYVIVSVVDRQPKETTAWSFDEAERVLQQATERHVENPILVLVGYNIAVLKGDKAGLDRISTLAKGKPTIGHAVAHAEALALARSGRLQLARQSSSRAIELALQERQREAAASYQAARAVWEAVCGNTAEAKTNAMTALDLSNGRDVEYAAALALGLSGDASRSEALAGDLEQRFPEDTFVKFTYVPVLRALAALERGKPTDSVERLQIALPNELAVNGLNFNHFYLGGLHSAYVRGDALLAAHRYAEAAAEFQKLLDHRGIVGVDPIGGLAHLQLGRAFVLSGDAIKAKAAYHDFLTLWKDADSDIPILVQAKAEYARLQ